MSAPCKSSLQNLGPWDQAAPPSPGRNHPATLPQLTPRKNVQGTRSAMGMSAPDKGYLCPPSHPHQSWLLRKGAAYPAPLDTERPETSVNSSSEVDRAWLRGKNKIKDPTDRAYQTRPPSPGFPEPLSLGLSSQRRDSSPQALKNCHHVQKFDSAAQKYATHNTSGWWLQYPKFPGARDRTTLNAPELKTVLSELGAWDYTTHNAPGRGHASQLDLALQL